MADDRIETAVPEKSGETRLSTVSREYDRGNKGYLDETEAKMRALDLSNRGHISNEAVYDMMARQTELQGQIFGMKRVVIGLSFFTIVLALSNLATAWAAVVLAKDTKVDTNVDTGSGATTATLMTKDGSAVVGTKNVGFNLDLEMIDEGNGTSHACVNVDVLSSAWNEVASGSPVAVVTKSETDSTKTDSGITTSENLRILSGATSNDGVLCFTTSSRASPICAMFSDDRCNVDEDGERRLLSENRRLQRGRRNQAAFRRLVETDRRRLACNPPCHSMNENKCGDAECAAKCPTECGVYVTVVEDKCGGCSDGTECQLCQMHDSDTGTFFEGYTCISIGAFC